MTAVAAQTELAELHRILRDVEGWLTDEEAEALYTLARSCTGKGAIVELGSWKGRSTVCLGLGSKAGAGVPVYAVDRPRGDIYEAFERNIRRAGVEDVVRPVNSSSEEAARDFDEPIELLFIDASHKYDLVKLDWDLWVPKLVEGGVLAMHDTTWFDGPKRIAEERLYRSDSFRDVRFVFSSTSLGTKVAANTRADRLRARYALGVKKAFEVAAKARNIVPKPLETAGRRILRSIQ
jgi:predicted O-methyltransferase YrrM